MRRILVLALLLLVSLPKVTLAQTGANSKTKAPPAKSLQPPKAQTELDKAIAERDRLTKERKFKEAQSWAHKTVEILRKQRPGTLELARGLDHLAAISYLQGDYSSAESAALETLAVYQKLVPGTVEELGSLLFLAIVAGDRKDWVTAENRLEAAHVLALKLPHSSLTVASILTTLGVVTYGSGRLDLAKQRLEAALAIYQANDPGSLGMAEVSNNLGLIALDRRDLAGAKRMLDAALEVFEKLAPDSLSMANCLTYLGIVDSLRGDLLRAEQRHEAAAKIRFNISPLSLDMAVSLNNLGGIAHARGELDRAQMLYESAYSIQRALSADSVDAAMGLHNIGVLAMHRGDLREARRRIEAALSILERVASNSLNTVLCKSNLGLVIGLSGDLAGAKRIFESALALCERLAPNSLELALCHENLGLLAAQMAFDAFRNDAPKSAELDYARRQFEAALAVRESIAPSSGQGTDALMGLGAVAWIQGDLTESQRLFEAAHTILVRLVPNSIDVVMSLGNLATLARTRQDQRILAEVTSQRMVLLSDLVSKHGLSRTDELGSIGETTSEALRTLGWHDDPKAFYRWLPTLRSAGITLRAAAKIVERKVTNDPDVLRQVSAVKIATKSETDWATGPRPKGLSQKDWDDRLLDLRAQRQSAELDLSMLLRSKDVSLGWNLMVELKDVQTAIPTDGALVEFLRISTWNDKARYLGPDAYGAFIVRHEGKVNFVSLGDADEIDRKVCQFMALVAGDASSDRAQAVGSRSTSTKGQSRAELGKELYRQLIAPLGKLPANLQIAPDGSLHALAFDALQNRSGKYLLELKNVSLVGSGRDLAVKPPTAPTTEPVVFGVGTFNADLAAHGQAVKMVAAKLDPPTTVSRGNRGGSVWGSLPGAVAEAKEVASRLNVEPILDSEAIEERLLSTKNPKVLHLATHGFSFPPAFKAPKRDRMEMMGMGDRIGSADNPMLRSGIVLAGANDEEKLRAAGYQDGWVTALDLSLMDLRGTELVVLSACDTGLGDVRQSEGVFGLQRALKFAGAQTLIMTLFEVPDASTEKLMTSFYDNWKPASPAGSKQQALRDAKLKLMRDPKTRSPKNWAGFVLLGDR